MGVKGVRVFGVGVARKFKNKGVAFSLPILQKGAATVSWSQFTKRSAAFDSSDALREM